MDVRVELWRKLSAEKLMLLNCGIDEDSLRVPWTARRSNQSILKEISPGCSLEGLMLKLKLQYFGHLMWKVDSLEKTLIWEGLGAGGEGDDRGWDGWMASLTRWRCVWVNSGSLWWTGRPGVLRFMGSQRVGHDWATELIWTYGKIVFVVESFIHVWLFAAPWKDRSRINWVMILLKIVFLCAVCAQLVSHVWLFERLWTARLPCPWNFPGKDDFLNNCFLI